MMMMMMMMMMMILMIDDDDDDDDVLDLIRLSQSGCEQSCADAPVMFHHLYIDMPVAFK